jgi:hypothetical protein
VAKNDAHPSVAVLRCIECLRTWDAPAERWRIYLTDEREPLLYCPGCAGREFDDS